MILPAKKRQPDGKYAICAFYTIEPGAIHRETFPKAISKKLPPYQIPVFLIAQMAVDLKHQNQGLGKTTLINALEKLWDINSRMKAYAVIVDCLNIKVEAFYSKFGFEILCIHNDRTRMYIPMKTIETLFQ